MIGLDGVVVGSADLAADEAILEAICGAGGAAAGGRWGIELSGARIELRGDLTPGIRRLVFGGADLRDAMRRLEQAAIPFVEDAGVIIGSAHANGVEVALTAGRSSAASAGEARLDHVALRVGDLPAASERWEALLGVTVEQMGVHPVSGGAFTAARLLLGERMIELVAPVAGVPSNIAARLESDGEGPAALALPVADVVPVKARLEDLGVRVLWREPHWFVHPKDCAAGLVQLTPRVNH